MVVADPDGDVAASTRPSPANTSQWRAKAKDFSAKFPTITISKKYSNPNLGNMKRHESACFSSLPGRSL
jgi:hypothetical protein